MVEKLINDSNLEIGHNGTVAGLEGLVDDVIDTNLGTLESNVSKNATESIIPIDMLKNPVLKSGLDKIYQKLWENKFKNEWLTFEKGDSSVLFSNILYIYPDLWMFLSRLWIDIEKKNFKEYGGEAKFLYTALDRVLKKKPKNWVEFQKKFEDVLWSMSESLDSSFAGDRLQLGQTKKNLTEMFWLDTHESAVVVEYLNVLKNFPSRVQEAGIGAKLVISLIIFIAWAVFGAYTYHRFTTPNTWTLIVSWEWEIGEFAQILKTQFREANFQKAGFIKKEQFAVDPNGNPLWNFGKEVINSMQSLELSMRVKGKIGLSYDFKDLEAHYQVKRDEHWKEIVMAYLKIKKPTVIITDSKSEILHKNRERVQLDAFNQAESELKEKLETEMIKKFIEGNDYEEALKGSQNDLKQAIHNLLSVWVNRTVEIKIDIEWEGMNIPFRSND